MIDSALPLSSAQTTTSAGCVGPNIRVDHDSSLLVPEIWCRMRVAEREPEFMIRNGFLEKVEDFEYGGKTVLASRLGYRISSLFVDRFLGRIFEAPGTVFPLELLRPEIQNPALFAEGIFRNLFGRESLLASDWYASAFKPSRKSTSSCGADISPPARTSNAKVASASPIGADPSHPRAFA